MPRIYTSASDPVDYCKICFPSEPIAEKKYGSVGDGPDGRGNCFGWDAEHPDYEGEQYHCVRCGGLLTEEDN